MTGAGNAHFLPKAQIRNNIIDFKRKYIFSVKSHKVFLVIHTSNFFLKKLFDMKTLLNLIAI